MVINTDSQLGLRFKDQKYKVQMLKGLMTTNENELHSLQKTLNFLEEKIEKYGEDYEINENELLANNLDSIDYEKDSMDVRKAVELAVGETNIINDDGSFYLITNTVYKAAELVKVGTNYTSRTLKDIKLGKHTYLLGKHEMIRFVCVIGAIKGFYFNDKDNTAFEFHYDLQSGGYYFPSTHQEKFTMFSKILTFVELGDIEVKILQPRQSLGTTRENKTTNSTNNTVYVVDSTWNQILIRTEGFAVRGHYRLQPCGPNNLDRKLIWVSAFEKNGYTRKPKGSIRE